MNTRHVLTHGSSHRQPHDHLDGFGSPALHVIEVIKFAQSGWVSLEQVEEFVVPLGGQRAEVRAMQLVGHPTGCDDHNAGIVVGIHCFAQGLAQLEVAERCG